MFNGRMQILHHPCIFRTFYIHSRSLSSELPGQNSLVLYRRGACCAADARPIEQRLRACCAADTRRVVYGSSVLCVSYTFLQIPALKTDSNQLALCMAPAYSESDTQDFGKSCVSLLLIGLSIHKSKGPEGLSPLWTSKMCIT